MSSKPKPILEAKVKVGSATAGVTGLVMSSLEMYVFSGEVPGLVEQTLTQGLGAVVPAVLTFAAGYITRHTPRVDIEATDGRMG